MEEQTVAVVSDIHANRPALEAVLDDIDSRAVDDILCAGDIVGILGWNDWTVETVRDRCGPTVFGNHDSRVRPDFAYAPSFQAARDEHSVVTDQLESDHIDWLADLPDRIETDDYVLAHARPFYFRDPGFPCHGYAQGDTGLTAREFTRVGPHLDGRCAFIGHTHEQHAVDCDRFEGQSGLVLNPGSVGVPWYEPADYATVDLVTQEYELHSVEYDIDRVEQQLESQGNPVGKYSTDSRLYNTTR